MSGECNECSVVESAGADLAHVHLWCRGMERNDLFSPKEFPAACRHADRSQVGAVADSTDVLGAKAAMIQAVKRFFRKTGLYWLLRGILTRHKQSQEYRRWVRDGMQMPPPHIAKQNALKEVAKRFGLRVLVETGTYQGDMVEAMKDTFDRIYTIELSPELHRRAADRFRRNRNVEVILGDSGTQLGSVVAQLKDAALFWLDGHYSAGVTARGAEDTPIYRELEHILGSGVPGHVIVIDDARSFGSDPAYPTLGELRSFVESRRPGYMVDVTNDSIRLLPLEWR